MGTEAALTAGVGAQAIAQIGAGIAADRQARENAELLEDLGILAADDIRRETRELVGRQRAAVAASGGRPGEGSALDLELHATTVGERSATRAQFGFDAQAQAIREQGRAALIAGLVNASGTILGSSLEALGQNPSTSRQPQVLSRQRTTVRPDALRVTTPGSFGTFAPRTPTRVRL